jgi:hypothetical protein
MTTMSIRQDSTVIPQNSMNYLLLGHLLITMGATEARGNTKRSRWKLVQTQMPPYMTQKVLQEGNAPFQYQRSMASRGIWQILLITTRSGLRISWLVPRIQWQIHKAIPQFKRHFSQDSLQLPPQVTKSLGLKPEVDQKWRVRNPRRPIGRLMERDDWLFSGYYPFCLIHFVVLFRAFL